MAMVPRSWQLGALAVSFTVALPVVFGDLLVVRHFGVAFMEVFLALPW